MKRIIAVANQKGGVGKTTTTINLAAALAEEGRRILVVDLDPQGNTTSGFGVEKSVDDITSYDVMLGSAKLFESLKKDVVYHVDLVPAGVDLAAVEIELADSEGVQMILKNALAGMKDAYDYIFIDCPPSLGLLTVNALAAADTVLVPIQCEFYALEGLSQLTHTISLVKGSLNPSLEIEGILFTMYDSRTKLSVQVVENVRENISDRIFNTIIPRNIRLAEAPSYGEPINLYEPRSSGAEAYRLLAREIIAAG